MASFLLENLDNYKKTITNNISEIYSKYTEQIFDYITNIYSINIENNNYIIKKGIEIQTYVFKYIFLYTFNLDMAIYHMKNAQIYYIEFVSQINNESNSFLKLTLKDSALFVYKKTIFDINTNHKGNYNINDNNSHKIYIINKLIDIFNLLLYTIFDNLNNNVNNNVNNDKISNNYLDYYKLNKNSKIHNDFNNIKLILQKNINNNIITLLNFSLNNYNIDNENDIYANDLQVNDILMNDINIYKSLDNIYYLLSFINNDILNNIFYKDIINNTSDTFDKNSINEEIINTNKLKISFLINVIELFIKVINKNFINNFYIDKSSIEKKISSFELNNIDINCAENPIKFINWLIK